MLLAQFFNLMMTRFWEGRFRKLRGAPWYDNCRLASLAPSKGQNLPFTFLKLWVVGRPWS
jgi:hypothetical protein